MRGNVVAAICDTAVSNISIHASTWEATTSGLLSVCGNIFQFTPLHERQRDPKDKGSKNKYFNSRLYMRGNVNTSVDYWATYLISIHASTWEATLWQRWHTALHIISIHASTWEATEKGERTCWIYKFQFTPLHERQHCNLRTAGWYVVFQFTPLHERQQELNTVFQKMMIFQFTPLHERQQESLLETVVYDSISIHASTWEATIFRTLPLGVSTKFQFTPLHERQRCRSSWEKIRKNFNSRLYMRGNRRNTCNHLDTVYFNSRLYMRGNYKQR